MPASVSNDSGKVRLVSKTRESVPCVSSTMSEGLLFISG